MAAVIKASSVFEQKPSMTGIATSALAAQNLLNDNSISDDSVDLLINVGVFRDENIFEPAIAALIQREAGIGLAREPEQRQILSFDLNNSSCGFLHAVEVVNSFFDADETTRAIIVAGDYHPGCTSTEGCVDMDALPYSSVGASVLLEYTDEPGVGFGPVYVDTVYDDSDEAYLDFRMAGTSGRNWISVVSSGSMFDRSIDMAADLALKALQGVDLLDMRRVLLITAPYSREFAEQLGDRLGLIPQNVDSTYRPIKDPHTSALALSYHDLDLDAVAQNYDNILFVSVGVGITAAAAVYVLPEKDRRKGR
jgi:3-oxoacyl-[acyl-carrier-protein] synthase III